MARRARTVAVVLGAACVGLGALGIARPDAFRVAAWVLATLGFLAAGSLLFVAGWRLHRAVRALDAFADEVGRQ